MLSATRAWPRVYHWQFHRDQAGRSILGDHDLQSVKIVVVLSLSFAMRILIAFCRSVRLTAASKSLLSKIASSRLMARSQPRWPGSTYSRKNALRLFDGGFQDFFVCHVRAFRLIHGRSGLLRPSVFGGPWTM